MNYNDVTIEQFQKLTTSIRLRGDNVYELGMDILDIFEGRDRKDLKLMSVAEFDKDLAKYDFMNKPIDDSDWVKEFKHNGKTYKVNQTPETWNVGQFVSMASLTKSEESIINNLNVILAAMCEKDDEKVYEVAQEFKTLPISIAYPIAVFFCGVMALLPPDIVDSLKVASLTTSQSNGGGTI